MDMERKWGLNTEKILLFGVSLFEVLVSTVNCGPKVCSRKFQKQIFHVLNCVLFQAV